MTATITQGWYSPVFVKSVPQPNDLRSVIADFDPESEEYGNECLVLKRGSVIKCIREEQRWHFGVWFGKNTMSAKEGWYAAEYVVPYYTAVKAPLAPTDQERKEAAEDRIYRACLNHGKKNSSFNNWGDTSRRQSNGSSFSFWDDNSPLLA